MHVGCCQLKIVNGCSDSDICAIQRGAGGGLLGSLSTESTRTPTENCSVLLTGEFFLRGIAEINQARAQVCLATAPCSLPAKFIGSVVAAREWLPASHNKPPRLLGQNGVLGLYPANYRGKVLWDPEHETCEAR